MDLGLSLEDQNKITLGIGIPSSILSLLATTIVFSLYLLNPSLQIFPFRMVVYLQIADFMMACGQFMNVLMHNFTPDDDDVFLCLFQAFLCQYGALSTMIWSIQISTMMVTSLSRTMKWMEQWEPTMIFIGFYMAGFISVMFSMFLYGIYLFF